MVLTVFRLTRGGRPADQHRSDVAPRLTLNGQGSGRAAGRRRRYAAVPTALKPRSVLPARGNHRVLATQNDERRRRRLRRRGHGPQSPVDLSGRDAVWALLVASDGRPGGRALIDECETSVDRDADEAVDVHDLEVAGGDEFVGCQTSL